MFAIINTGSKQYTVKKNSIVQVEKLEGNVGDEISFNPLMISNEEQVFFEKGSVIAQILEQKKDKKVYAFKKKRRKNYSRKVGHRQQISVLKVMGISL